jgi:hypothetical protein
MNDELGDWPVYAPAIIIIGAVVWKGVKGIHRYIAPYRRRIVSSGKEKLAGMASAYIYKHMESEVMNTLAKELKAIEVDMVANTNSIELLVNEQIAMKQQLHYVQSRLDERIECIDGKLTEILSLVTVRVDQIGEPDG